MRSRDWEMMKKIRMRYCKTQEKIRILDVETTKIHEEKICKKVEKSLNFDDIILEM